MQALEATARAGGKVSLPQRKRHEREGLLGADLRLESEFVDNLLLTGSFGTGAAGLNVNAISEAQIERARAEVETTMTAQADTATMHPANLVGKYHAWKIKNNYAIPGKAVVDDYRRRFLSMYAKEEEKALEPVRRDEERRAEVKIAVLDKYDEVRLNNRLEDLVGQIDGVLVQKENASKLIEAKDTTFPGSYEDLEVFRLMTARKVVKIEEMFLRGDVNVNMVEPGSSATGLSRACSLGLLTAVKLYLKAGADANHATLTGMTSLHCAWDGWMRTPAGSLVKQARYLVTRDIVLALCEYGADTNMCTHSGVTPLHMAATFGHEDIVATLLRHNADRSRRDGHGRLAVDLAKAHGHRGCARLLANWHWVEKAQKQEEFRMEWDKALEAGVGRDRSRIYGVRGSSSASASGAAGAALAGSDDPRKAERLAVQRDRESLFHPGGKAQSAVELLKSLDLQERLRLRRKALQSEALAVTMGGDGGRMLPVADYDLDKDAIRVIDMAADAEAVGDSNRATRVRLAANVGYDVSRLPWGQKAKKTRKAEDEAAGLDAQVDEHEAAIEEEEADEEEEARLRREAEENHGYGHYNDEEEGEQHADGVAAEAVFSGQLHNVIRQDSTRHLSTMIYGTKTPKPLNSTSSSASSIGGFDLLMQAGAGSGSDSGSGSGGHDGGGGSNRRLATASMLATPLGNAGSTRNLFGEGKRKKDGTNSTFDVKISRLAAKSDSLGIVDMEEDVTIKHVGPAANVDSENKTLQAQRRKETWLKWRRETSQGEEEREEKREEVKARDSLLDLSGGTDLAQLLESAGAKPPGRKQKNRGPGSGTPSTIPEEDAGDDAAAAPVQPSGNPEIDRLRLKHPSELTPEEESKLKAAAEHARLMAIYRGAPKVAKSKGHDVASRRVNVANMIASDIPENISDYTRTYGEAIITRKPAGSSSILRHGRLRVDTRNTIDAGKILHEGRAFETLMTSDGATAAAAQLAAQRREGGGGDDGDEAANSGGAAGGIVGIGRGGLANASIAGVSQGVLPTIDGGVGATRRHGAMTLHSRPDTGMDPQLTARLKQELIESGVTIGNSSSERSGFGTVAVNEPGLLPATSAKRAMALKAQQKWVAGGGGGGGAFASAATEVAADGSSSHFLSGGAASNPKQKALGTRKLLLDARSKMAGEAVQATIMANAEAEEAAARGPPRASILDPNVNVNEPKVDSTTSKKKSQKQQGDDGKPELGTYGQGLMSSWPLHAPGHLDAQPGRGYRDYSMLDTLTAVKESHDQAVDKAAHAYRRYQAARALRASKKASAGHDTGGASATVTALGSVMEQAAAKAKEAIAAAEEARKRASTKDMAAKPDAAVPALSQHAAESLDFLRRLPPQRTVIQDLEERDMRASRVSKYQSYNSVEDPWRYARYNMMDPTAKFAM